MIKHHTDIAIIGGGFYGCAIALHLKKHFKKVIILEKEPDLLLKASYNNQARVHNGYHYPRSFITAFRSHQNYGRFIKEYAQAVNKKFTMTYAVGNLNSKITSSQFVKFCNQIGSPVKAAPDKIRRLFDNRLIEDVFMVDEVVFNAAKLRTILKDKLKKQKVKVLFNSEVTQVISQKGSLKLVYKNGKSLLADMVLNCSYANINQLLKNSKLPTLPFKYELTEMPLLKLPPQLSQLGITIMDGPFFSVMPFPDKRLHSLHHVRYTPHEVTFNTTPNLKERKSKYLYMIKDAQRYVPLLTEASYKGSLFEVKTLLFEHENTDARPILFRKDYGFKNFHVILGGKIDNIYDIVEAINQDLLN